MKSQRVYTISMRLWFLGIGAIATILTIGLVSYWSTNTLRNHMSDMVEIQLPAVKNMGLTDMMHDGIRGNATGAIVASINKDEKELANLKKESEDFAKQIAEYVANLEALPLEKEAKESIASSKVYIATYLKSSADILAASMSGDTKKAVELVPNLQKEFEHLEETLGKLNDLISAQAVTHGDEAIKRAKSSTILSLGITVVAFFLALVTCLFAIRSINSELEKVIKDLGKESKKVGNTAERLNRSATELATETTQQASALQETASSMDEISAMVKLTSDNSNELERSAKRSLESAATGQNAIQQMLVSMSTISSTNDKVMSQVEDNTRQISGIMQMMGEISTKTKVINDIVFQTKLLSFNASVEAARAGEHGKGFAVVAEEVGNLARMSGNAAKEITDLLDSSVRKVEEIVSQSKRKVDVIVGEAKTTISSGVNVAKQCDTALQSIVKQSTQVNELITAITQAIREQDQGVAEVSKALRILDQSTNQNEATAKETRTSADELLAQSEAMERIVGHLERLSGLSAVLRDTSSNSVYADPEAHKVTKSNVDKAFGVVKQFKAQDEIHVASEDEIKKAS